MSYLSLSNTSLVAIAISFAVICITIFSLRIVAQIKAKQALKDELAQHDNFAMGISFASEITVVIATMAFLFDEISMSTAQHNPLKVVILIVLLFTFIKVGHLIHRKWILHRFNEEAAILKQNVCAALVDSGMLLANCIIALGLYTWTHAQGFSNLLIAFVSFFTLQGMFALDSKIREYRFAKANQGASLQSNFNLENTSIGIRYAGKSIGLALAVYAGLSSAAFQNGKMVENIFTLVMHCGVMWVLLYCLSFVIKAISLPNIDAALEVDHQDNIGIACIEFAVFCAIGYLLISMFSL
ncbi:MULTISPECIES: hypothetical protein [Pseudoalteromonas]|uniref:DUF350 domain-containing protein n=1 Tax=Pseudoalteromonas atlantica TaxID=288 RepID=A0ABQ0UDR7_PSEAF|nr:MULTISPECIES: hypothetical protein [Pseudoalteromonas]MCP4056182.1 hypothetical protein [Pseudoalteromonas sp.]GEK76326.1 hypothetical protein PAT01_16300 [Pseudoalteromonas atlantica]ENN99734.1 hypothetical protein J139_05812 [Pseudoalteromonas agarivorans S816]MCK8094632.1 hypothetical protein [Pseudoalteromonas sp. 1CM17D]MCK8107314.1 hypothetical protein [Pseudoalteromonas sp. 2CM41L]|tara:strand:+ start:325 stop:1218 length:894 start_codon:yes stop_codon:yes gene_type:complete